MTRFLITLLLLLVGSSEARLRAALPGTKEHQAELPQVQIRDLQVEVTGLGGSPDKKHLPLQMCEGDCDNDEDCDVGLLCFQRDRFEAVPGCIGGLEEGSKTDFCVPATPVAEDDAEEEEEEEEVVVPSTPAPTLPAPTTPQPTPLPTNSPTRSPVFAITGTVNTDTELLDEINMNNPFITPTKEIEKVGNNGWPASAYPLGECQGDCDDDDECGEDLICFHRDGGEDTPGCIGEDRSRNDYCIKDPNSVQMELYFPPTTQPSSMPSINSLQPTGSSSPTMNPTISPVPTIPPSDYPSTVPSDFPSGVPTSSSSPTFSPAPTVPPSGSPTVEPLQGIRIKLYWEEGYTWQDETIERKWCMIRNYRGFPGTGKCWHGLHTEPCHQDMIYVARCDSDKRQQFSVIPMPGGTQFQIAVYDSKSNQNHCMERVEYSLILRECNYMNPLQRFWIPRGAIFQKRFELSPITLANHCITQAHHPKSGEVVELHKCSRARHEDHQSSFWTVY